MNTLLSLLIIFTLNGGDTDPKKKEQQTMDSASTSEIRMKLTDLLYDIEDLMEEDTLTNDDIATQIKMGNDMLGTLRNRNMLRVADSEAISTYYQKVEKNEMSQEDLQHYLKLMSNYTYGAAKAR